MNLPFPSWLRRSLPRLISAVLGASIIGAVAWFVLSPARAVAEHLEDRPGALPTSPELDRWLLSVKELERGLHKGEPHFSFEMKKAHVYAKVLEHGEVVGRFRPETTSTSIRAEVTTFNIGRALGCGDLFQPAAEITLRGKGLVTFRRLLEEAAFSDVKDEERRELLRAMNNEPDILLGVYKPMSPANAQKYRGAERTDEPPNGGLETSDVVARFLRHDAPQPGRDLLVLPHTGLHVSPAHLARQLSDILLVDALAGQWDRFSGNNLHVVPTAEGAHFLAIDNGGADPLNDQGYLEKFTHWVTRFDRPVVEHLWALDAFLKKRGRFREFANESALAATLGFDDPQEWKAFKDRVHQVAAHTRAIKTGAFFEP